MAFIRRRRPAYKRKAYVKKRTMNISRPRTARNVLTCKRTFYNSTWTPSVTTTADFWRYLSFQLQTMPSYAEFTALFDQYKINGIKVTLRPRYDSFAGNDTTDTTLPGVTNQGGCTVHVINDKFSQLTPTGVYSSTNLNTFLEQGNVKSYNGTKPFSFYISKPAYDMAAGGAFTTARKSGGWLQTSSVNVPLNGAHVYIQDVNNTGVFNQAFDVFLTYYMSFKSMK